MGIDSVTNGFVDSYSGAGRTVVATFGSYAEAERTVDRLSDEGFPVQYTDIVGRELRLVERVSGRLTTAGAAWAGAGTGAWFGLFIGLLVGLFTPTPIWLGLILGGVLIGGIWGAVFGFVAHRALRGRRDFASARGLVADRYELTVVDAWAELAQQMLARSR
ncbi:general stress protein [Virgisporangium aurantiacum]|uniref:Membrane protein n=1 Tax=Virgisporangium aurantiacum TaxID=175570 RepID=A0A8J3Z0R5_9ACTN|nr:general stress protein [Virgisporangium aurantiacum]GIJ54347.1 membrane protein [Virgisporangium aurantiacum]